MKKLVGIIGFGALMLSAQAEAATPKCGSTVNGSVTLTSSMKCTSGHGLVLGAGATLDCNGRSITGGNISGQYGIYLRNSNATVRNCIVQNFEVGIRVRAATNVTVINNTSKNNTRYGLELTNSSSDALIENNTITANGDEGIHVSGPADRDAGNVIKNNTISANALEGIYLLDTDGNTISDNIVRDQKSAGMYVKASNRNTFTGNTLTNDPIQLVYGSQQNVFRDNTIVQSRIKFDDARLHTGDVGYMDEEGYFFIVDRIKDMIISGGYNIYPRNIEEALQKHPDVVECCVIGIDHPVRGQVPKAFVVKKEGSPLTEAELKTFLKEDVAAYAMPTAIEFRETLPKSMIGKILKKELIAEEKSKSI